LGQAGWPRPSGNTIERSDSEAGFTGSTGGVRAPFRNAKMEPKRREAMRNRFQSSEVTRGGFGPCANRSCPKGNRLLLRTSTVRTTLATSDDGLPATGLAKRKTPKGGTTGAFGTGRTQRLGRTRTLPQRWRCRKRHRWPVSKMQPESEEARPVAPGERSDKIGS